FAEGIGELQAADIELEALGEPGIARLCAGERRHRDGIVVKEGRRAVAELRLDPFEEDTEEQILPVIAVMRRDAERCRGRGEKVAAGRRGVGCRRQEIDAATVPE